MKRSSIHHMFPLLAALLAAVLLLSGCAYSESPDAKAVSEELLGTLRSATAAYHAEMTNGLTGIVDIYQADGNWYSVATDYSGSEMLLYQEKLYSRQKFNTADTNWMAHTAEGVDYSALIPGGNTTAALVTWLTVPDETNPFEKTEANGSQTIYTFSKEYTQSILDRQVSDAEALLQKVSQDEKITQIPGLLDFYAFSAEYLRRNTYTNAALTVTREKGKITAIRLSYDVEAPVYTTDSSGKETLSDETETHQEGVDLTFLDMEESAILAKIEEAAATLDT